MQSRIVFTPQMDRNLEQIVANLKRLQVKPLWGETSKIYLKTHNFFLNPKQCQNRFKNFINVDNPQLKLTMSQKEQVFDYHCEGHSYSWIKQKINITSISNKQLKMCCKVEKQKIGRCYRKMFPYKFRRGKNFSQNSKEDYRQLLILFRSSQLLEYYFTEHNIKIKDLKEKLNRYKCYQNQLKFTQKEQKTAVKQFPDQQTYKSKETLQNALLSLKKETERFFYKILFAYQQAYNRKQHFITEKKQTLSTKLKQARSIITGQPVQIQEADQFEYQEQGSESQCLMVEQSYSGFLRSHVVQELFYEDSPQNLHDIFGRKDRLSDLQTQIFEETDKSQVRIGNQKVKNVDSEGIKLTFKLIQQTEICCQPAYVIELPIEFTQTIVCIQRQGAIPVKPFWQQGKKETQDCSTSSRRDILQQIETSAVQQLIQKPIYHPCEQIQHQRSGEPKRQRKVQRQYDICLFIKTSLY